MLVSCSAYSSTLKMEAIRSSETLDDFQQTTWRYILEQALATYGTRAKRGTWNSFQWHAE
jgi:hypothetical protein